MRNRTPGLVQARIERLPSRLLDLTERTASPVHADGRLYYLSENRETMVVRLGVPMEIVARNKLDDGFLASPALDGDSLYLRTKSHVYRIGGKP